MIGVEYIDCGTMEYTAAWELQRQFFDRVARGEQPGAVMMVEHNHVYTLGKSGQENNMLIGADVLERIGATYVHVDRGGDITYHGPGQIVCYPILNLLSLGVSLREYIFKLEQVIIDTVATCGILGDRMQGATGVWIDGRRKIAAIGVRASRGVTMHGFALNVATDLDYFAHINACGFVDKGVTSINVESGSKCNMGRVKQELCRHFEQQFEVKLDH